MYLKHWKKTFQAILVWGMPFAVYMIPSFYCHLFGRLLVTLLIPVILLGWTLFAYQRLDESINIRFFPELVGKGTVMQ